MTDYENRLQIPLIGDSKTLFYTKSGLLVARGYDSIVIGKRGPYIEFNDTQIITDNLFVPKEQEYRLTSNIVYYIEFRTIDECYVKVYYQLKTVNYADYKLGKLYISPIFLKTDKLEEIISYAKKEKTR